MVVCTRARARWSQGGALLSPVIKPHASAKKSTKGVVGFKIFNWDWTCKTAQYRVGKTNRMKGGIEPRVKGFHFCKRALDCIRYYELFPSYKYARVRALGKVVTEADKSATDRLKVEDRNTPSWSRPQSLLFYSIPASTPTPTPTPTPNSTSLSTSSALP